MPYPSTPSLQAVPVQGGIATAVLAGPTTMLPIGHNESISGGLAPVRITTATTTTLVTGPGRLCRIHCYGGTMGLVQVFDNTVGSGTVIPVGPRSGGYWPVAGSMEDLQIAFSTGLTIVTGAATLLAVTFELLI